MDCNRQQSATSLRQVLAAAGCGWRLLCTVGGTAVAPVSSRIFPNYLEALGESVAVSTVSATASVCRVKDEQKSPKKIVVIILKGSYFFECTCWEVTLWPVLGSGGRAVQLLLIALNALEGMRCFDAAVAVGPLPPFQN